MIRALVYLRSKYPGNERIAQVLGYFRRNRHRMVRDAVTTLSEQQELRLKDCLEDLQRIPEWEELTQEERGNTVNRLDGLALEATLDQAGLKKLLARDYDINSTLEELKRSIQRQGQERLHQRIEEERAKTGDIGPAKLTKSIAVPMKMTSAADIDALIRHNSASMPRSRCLLSSATGRKRMGANDGANN